MVEFCEAAAVDQEEFGPYRVVSELGKGGMGVVYLAEHKVSGDRVALKTLKRIRASDLRSIRREIGALKRLDHPYVVRVIDDGVSDTTPWYAMQHLSGVTLKEHISKYRYPNSMDPTEMLDDDEYEDVADDEASTCERGTLEVHTFELDTSMRQMLGWVADVCHSLAYLHGEGLVHADLKPANVIVTDEGRAVLVDFGVAAAAGLKLDTQAVSRAGFLQGTLKYMSPERIEESLFDTRADLYSVGCILYRIVTGKSAFREKTQAMMINAHLKVMPARPSKFAYGIPKSLDDLIMALLEKDPAARPGHAQIVLAALKRLGIGYDLQRAGLPEPRPYLHRSKLSGRSTLVEELSDCLGSVAGGAGRVIFLGGEAGVGKTRVAAELVRQARPEGFRILTGHCIAHPSHGGETMTGPPLQLFREVLATAVDFAREKGDFVRDMLLPHLQGLEIFAPEVLDLVDRSAETSLFNQGPEAARARVFDCLREILDIVTERRPLVFVFDDLHHADAMSVEAFRYLINDVVPSRNWLFLGLFRTDQVNDHVRHSLLKHPDVEHRQVARLGRVDVEKMVAEMLGLEEAPRGIVDFVHQHSGGNPSFVAECLWSAIDGGFLALSENGRWVWQTGRTQEFSVSPMPQVVRSLVQTRFDNLGEKARFVCRSASVIGLQGEVDILAQLCGLRNVTLEPELDELVRRDVFEWIGTDWVRFAHDKLAELFYQNIQHDERAEMHVQVAEILSARARDTGTVETALGPHWHRAGRWRKARGAYFQCAREAMRRYSLFEAESYYLAGLEVSEENDILAVNARLDLIEQVLLPQDRSDDAYSQGMMVVDRATDYKESGALARAYLSLGTVLPGLGRLNDGIEMLEGAIGLYRGMKDRRGEGTAVARLARVFVHEDAERARKVYREALEILEPLDLPVEVARAQGNLALMAFHEGECEEALARYGETLEVLKELGDRGRECTVLGNMSEVQLVLGCFNESRALLDRAEAINQETHHTNLRAFIQSARGELAAAEGNFELALEFAEESLGLYRAIGDRRGETEVMLRIADRLPMVGKDQRSTILYQRVMARAEELGFTLLEAEAHLGLARWSRLRGDLNKATTHLARATGVFAARRRPYFTGLAACERGLLELASGRLDRRPFELVLEIAERMGMTSRSVYCRRLQILRRAMEAAKNGKRLVHGQLKEDIPVQR
jgi:serine/threonine protein kinase/tetratricopeptide (TPR) repeat protein